MKEKTRLKIISILCILSLIITVISIQKTYAKYFEKVGTTYQTNLKRWLVNVNSKIIHEQTDLNQVMQPVIVENENMNTNNTLVPGRTGYFEMLIDYSAVDLAFEYEFFIDQLNENKLTDFEIYGYEVVDADGTSTITETKTIKGVIDPSVDLDSNGDRKKDIKVLFRWNDGDGSTMNNTADTEFEGEVNTAEGADSLHKVLRYKATMKFTQYIEPVSS